MKIIHIITASLTALSLAACASMPTQQSVLSLPYEANFLTSGAQHFTLEDGVLTSILGEDRGHLKMLGIYSDFDFSVDYWVEDGDTNSGVYVRCQDIDAVSPRTCYEMNIWDNHPEAENATGAILGKGAPLVATNSVGGWNTLTIRAQGDHLIMHINGKKTADIMDDTFGPGHIALQYGGDNKMIKFRNLEIAEK